MNTVVQRIAAKILPVLKIRQRFKRIQALYDKRVVSVNWLDIKEGFTAGDDEALEKLAQLVRKEKVMIAEIGSWKGFSTQILAKAVIDCHGSVFAVDHWRGNEGTPSIKFTKSHDIYAIFKKNMIMLGLWDTVHPFVTDSETASRVFADGVIDLVFLDADHRYSGVKKDIISWLPKLRGGVYSAGMTVKDITRNIRKR